MIRVMVVDDHEFVRTMMCELVDGTDDMQVVGEAPDGSRALPVAQATRPDVVLMDLSMPLMNGIDATREVTASMPEAQVIVLTTSTKGQDVHDAAAAGAVGFLSKGADPRDVLDAIRAVVTKQLEESRAAGAIGSSLQAEVVVAAPAARDVLAWGVCWAFVSAMLRGPPRPAG